MNSIFNEILYYFKFAWWGGLIHYIAYNISEKLKWAFLCLHGNQRFIWKKKQIVKYLLWLGNLINGFTFVYLIYS